VVGVNLIQVTAEFYVVGPERAKELFAKVGASGATVAYGSDTGIAQLHLEVTEEGDLASQIISAAKDWKALAEEFGDPEMAGLCKFDIHGEWLIALAGNQHRRGKIVPTS
jgi:hypothetical protein